MRATLLALTLVAAALAAPAAGVGPTPGPDLHRGSIRGLQSRPNSFRLSPPYVGGVVVGGVAIPRRYCRPDEIRALATTRHGPDGIMGVVEVRGAAIKAYTRCSLAIERGPLALVDARGRRLPVPLTSGNRTSPPTTYRGSDLAPQGGMAAYGFAWNGGYCGPPAAGVLLRRADRRRTRIVVPLTGPQPVCGSDGTHSTLVDGPVGFVGDAVQPAPLSYEGLALTAEFVGPTTTTRGAPVRLHLTNTTSSPIPLVPCPQVAGYYDNESFAGPYWDFPHYLHCVRSRVTIAAGAALTWTVPALPLNGQGGRGPAPAGSSWYVSFGIAGTPTVQLQTVVQESSDGG